MALPHKSKNCSIFSRKELAKHFAKKKYLKNCFSTNIDSGLHLYWNLGDSALSDSYVTFSPF